MEIFVDRWRRLPAHFKILVFLLAVGGSVAYGWTANVEPALEAVKAAEGENEALEKEVEGLNNAGKAIVAVQSELRVADEEIGAMLNLLPGDPEVDRVLGYFAAASKETGVEVKEFEPVAPTATDGQAVATPVATAAPGAPAAPGTPAGGQPASPSTMAADAKKPKAPVVDESVSKTKIKVKLSGSFTQIATFFDRILSLPRVIRLSAFELRNNAKASTTEPTSADVSEFIPGSPKLTVSATFDAYYQKGLIEQFREEDLAAPKAKPVPDAKAATSGAPTPSDPAAAKALSAKPLGGATAP